MFYLEELHYLRAYWSSHLTFIAFFWLILIFATFGVVTLEYYIQEIRKGIVGLGIPV
jgi:hypothetical protein